MAAILVVDAVSARRSMIEGWLKGDGHEIVAHETLRKAAAMTRARKFTAIFLTWKPGGPEGISDWEKMGWAARDLVAIVTTIAEGKEAAAWCGSHLPEACLTLLHASDGRLTVQEYSRATKRILGSPGGTLPSSP